MIIFELFMIFYFMKENARIILLKDTLHIKAANFLLCKDISCMLKIKSQIISKHQF